MSSTRVESCLKIPEDEDISNILSPSSDEVIMMALDRILYYSGTYKISHLKKPNSDKTDKSNKSGNCKCSSQSSVKPTPLSIKASSSSIRSVLSHVALGKSSLLSLSRYSTPKSKTSYKSPSVSCKTARSTSFKSNSTIPKCGTSLGSSRPRTARVDFANSVSARELAGETFLSNGIKTSISACSSIYKRLNAKLSEKKQNSLWTKLVHSENGCKIYEVYQNSDTENNPSNVSNSKNPVILFLVMPNGYVMTFESLSA